MPFDPDKYLSEKSSFDPDKYLSEKQSFGERAAGALGTAFEYIDRYTGAPTRSAIGAIQEGENPLTAFGAQFGEESSKAPTGKQIAQRAGVPDTSLSEVLPWAYSDTGEGLPFKKGGLADPTASGAVGLGVDIAADPTNLIPGKVISGATSKAFKGLSKISEPASVAVSKFLKSKAGKLAESATGATRTQAEKFAKGAGEQLLDRGVVKFGSTPSSIATTAARQMDDSGKVIAGALGELDKKGVKATADEVLEAIQNKIDDLYKSGAGNAPQARQLEGIKEDLVKSLGGEDQLLSQIEKQKRSFGNVNWQDPDKALARKSAYRALMDKTSQKAAEALPGTAKAFEEAKDTYGLLSPIQEAAEKRALQLNQSPWMGLLDTATLGTGLATDNEELGIVAPIARRLIAPRLKSSAAAITNALSKGAQKAPGVISSAGAIGSAIKPAYMAAQGISRSSQSPSETIGKLSSLPNGTQYSGVLSSALKERGQSGYSATYYLLQQTDPEFRRLLENNEGR